MRTSEEEESQGTSPGGPQVNLRRGFNAEPTMKMVAGMCESRVVATFEDKYGDMREIYRAHGPKSRLMVRKNSSTASLELNRIAAVRMGVRLRELRIKAGLTMAQLGIMAGLTGNDPKDRIWAIENAVRGAGVRLGTLYALAIALKCETSDILPTRQEVLESDDLNVEHVRTMVAV